MSRTRKKVSKKHLGVAALVALVVVVAIAATYFPFYVSW
jgi:hypothetical protein